ncbi:hypothetical protein Tco_1241540 [Tanacetum coccineum]
MAEEAVTSLVGKSTNSLFGVAKKEISYMSNSSKNVEDLKRENEKLTQYEGQGCPKIITQKIKVDRLLRGVEVVGGQNAESQYLKAKELLMGEANAEARHAST